MRNRPGTRFPIVSFLCFLALLGTIAAPSASFAQPASPAVTSFRVYRAIDSRLLGGVFGDAGTRIGNTNAGSAGGVLGYIHAEVIPTFAVPNAGGRRLNDIDAIAVFEVQALNVRRAQVAGPAVAPGTVKPFGPFMAFNGGMATPPQARNQILRYGAFVGFQDQTHNARHAYPGEWYSFVGACPLSRWGTGEDGNRGKPSPCPTEPSLDGICPATGGAPDGTPLCQYKYTYLGYVRLDDLVGITSKTAPLCQTDGTPRACADYADFRRNGGVEYAAGPIENVECDKSKVPESGLPFWRGRCDPERARDRIRTLTNWSALVVSQSLPK